MPFALVIGALATDAGGGVLVCMHGFLFIQALLLVTLLVFLLEKGEENVQFFIELFIFVV
ncbi:glycerol kinase [Lysinibacillus fusiformis]|uniref:glycerol kinase n=1 Tax=Lysinibacillus fusiformis TaxID=28031 RepID=UPI0037F93B89